MSIQSKSTVDHNNPIRKKILVATINCIDQHGFHGATMSVIAETCGLTRGALQHYFGNKRIDLIVATAEHLYYLHIKQFNSITRHLTPQQILSDTWQLQKKLYCKKENIVLIEIWMACHSDPKLAKTIIPLFRTLDSKLGKKWKSLLIDSGLSEQEIETVRYLQRTLLRGSAVEYLINKKKKGVFDDLFDFADDATHLLFNSDAR